MSQPIMWNLDELIQTPHRMIPAYLTASYLYYHEPELPGIMEDTEFDKMCAIMLKLFKKLDHPHKYLIREESLKAGTGYDIPRDIYPNIVKSVAVSMSLGTLKKTMASKLRKKRRKPKK